MEGSDETQRGRIRGDQSGSMKCGMAGTVYVLRAI